jgi:hypothetical protein
VSVPTDPIEGAAGGPDAGGLELDDVAGQVQDVVLSLVAAGRMALDAIERLARDPAPLLEAVSALATVGRAAVAPVVRHAPSDDGDGEAVGATRPRVERIRVEYADG